MPSESKFSAPDGAVEQAKKYILAHPDESKMQQGVSTGLSERTIARARAELVRDGLLPASRKTKKSAEPAPEAARPVPVASPPTAPPPTSGLSGALDHNAMEVLAGLIDESGDDEIDEEKTRKRLLKQCLAFAFDTRLHPDTRMSASQMWSKLKDQTRARELGPGKPKTRDEAIARMSDLMKAVGAEITLAAVNRTFTVQEPTDATPVEAVDETPPPSAPV